MRVQSIARVLGVLAVGLCTTSVVVTVDNAPAGFVLRSNELLDAASATPHLSSAVPAR